MSKNAKIILIIVGIFAFISLLCVGGFGVLIYSLMDTAGFERSEAEGAEFGKTTDNLGCQTKVISSIKTLSPIDITGGMKTQYFFEKCLESSRPSPNFCSNVPSEISDIINDDKWKDAECERLGFRETPLPCRNVIKAKMSFCEKKH